MLAEFSIVPLGKGESLSKDVAVVLDLVDRSGLSYQFTAMGTIVEGEFDEVFALIKDCHTAMRQQANRILTTIRIDDRANASGRMEAKTRKVEDRLAKKLVTSPLSRDQREI
ncbi:MTH1187 family thiamine-binding protein [Candidatus Acetothermia bacterium]|nr:MTH1187 family thiamine-binding protein [Candidatus Acetothermia bacterium]